MAEGYLRNHNTFTEKRDKTITVLDGEKTDGARTLRAVNSRIPAIYLDSLTTIPPDLPDLIESVRSNGSSARLTVNVVAGKLGLLPEALRNWLKVGRSAAERLAASIDDGSAKVELTPDQFLCLRAHLAWNAGTAQRQVELEGVLTQAATTDPSLALRILESEDDKTASPNAPVMNVYFGGLEKLAGLAAQRFASGPPQDAEEAPVDAEIVDAEALPEPLPETPPEPLGIDGDIAPPPDVIAISDTDTGQPEAP